MMNLLEKCMKEYQKKEEKLALSPRKQFGLLQNQPESPRKKIKETQNLKFCNLLESPPRKQRKGENDDISD